MNRKQRRIYETGEYERDAARQADEHEHGSFLWCLFKWFEGLFRRQREKMRNGD